MKGLDHLLKSLRDAAIYNPEIQVAPVCILWPDRYLQWEKGDRFAIWSPLFKGDLINDHHLTLAEKRVAREAPE